ncbi:hypothetical protein D9758_016597 [Tetrapyrgos nigripes]|uniref:Uncharacterized protein n=1 Tax=Tetrapyrgos nigripes TaxID=182062 RepID=A0A8H5FLC1_9AGAR|nr:hypothetical protein D9758_016597 [Tetrapyrgos nigripes]
MAAWDTMGWRCREGKGCERVGGNECDRIEEDRGMGDDEEVKSGVIDSLKTGLGIPEGPEAQTVPIDLAVHEFLPPEASTLRNLHTFSTQLPMVWNVEENRTWVCQSYCCTGIEEDE